MRGTLIDDIGRDVEHPISSNEAKLFNDFSAELVREANRSAVQILLSYGVEFI